MRNYGILGIVLAFLIGACTSQEADSTSEPDAGPMEKTGEKMDEMADEMADETAKKMDEMGDEAAAALSAAYLHAKVRGKLLDGLGADALRIDIDVHGDVVTLTGTVRDAKTTELAADLVRTLDGVETVESNLVHKSASSDDPDLMDKAGTELSDAMIATEVRLALLDAIGSDALAVDIDVADGAIVLSGTVGSAEKVSAASEAVRGVKDVKSVENEIDAGS